MGARSKYHEPERESAEQHIKIKLFCQKNRCNNYIIGIEGYNGAFWTDDGSSADLRNQVWYCKKHERSGKHDTD